MAINFIKPIVLALYSLLVLFFGEFIMIRYSKSTMQMHCHNSVGRKNPEAYVIFNLILLIIAHALMIALNSFAWYIIFQIIN